MIAGIGEENCTGLLPASDTVTGGQEWKMLHTAPKTRPPWKCADAIASKDIPDAKMFRAGATSFPWSPRSGFASTGCTPHAADN